MPEETLKKLLKRRPDANKYDFGHVLVIGGSPGMVGAPFLAGQAALRTGAGLVTIASGTDVIDKLEKRAVEIMTLRVDEGAPKAAGVITAFVLARKVSAVVIGPGQTTGAAGLVLELLPRLEVPVVVDGGAINSFGGHLAVLKKAAAINRSIILTPHDGEYAKLAGTKPPVDTENRRQTILSFAKTQGVTIVLKGSRTLVAQPDGRIYENQTGNPGMATAGSGDVLSGVIAGLLAQGVGAGEAAGAGVYLHGLAGDLAARAKTQPGMTASDIAESIPAAFQSL